MTMTSSSKQQADVGTTGAADAIDLDALMQANIVRVFNERNSDRRRAALGELYAEDATLYDPETVATGREAISGAVDNLHLSLPPDFVFTATGHAVGHHGAARLFGRAGPRRGPAALPGTDVAHIEDAPSKLRFLVDESVARW